MEFLGPDSVSPEKFPIITKQTNNSICSIIKKDKFQGTGFLCKINYPDQLHLLPTLITCHHVLFNEEDKLEDTKIKIGFKNGETTNNINLNDSRKIYTSNQEKYDITIIEIKESDGLNLRHFLDVDDYLYEEDDLVNIYKEQQKNIYLIHYPKRLTYKVSFGFIKNISEDTNEIQHLSATDKGSSGCPIFNISNCKIIGVHKGTHKRYDYKVGSFLKFAIDEFNRNENIIKIPKKSYVNDNSNFNNNINNNYILNPINKSNYNVKNYHKNGNNNNYLNIYQNYNSYQNKYQNLSNNSNLNNENNNGCNNINYTNPTNQYSNNQNIHQDQIDYFPKKGLCNIDLTFYMNANLQCLLHVNELVDFFINVYPNYCIINDKNKNSNTKRELSEAFYRLVKGVLEEGNNSNSYSNLSNPSTYVSPKSKNETSKFFSPNDFKRVLKKNYPQFRFEANDSKDFILYLLKTIHEELNYVKDRQLNNEIKPNRYNKLETYDYFKQEYDIKNYSIISNIFFGTYEIITLCFHCKQYIYNFQKFEFISFELCSYHGKKFSIEDGFKDKEKPQRLIGDNKFYCEDCKKLCDGIIYSKIIQPPKKLLINLDYGRNKQMQPSKIEFGETIDITKFVDYGNHIKYNIIGVCTYIEYSGKYGNYVAYCRHRETGDWYKFNDLNVSKCTTAEIYGGSPYLLLYEKL